jgi:ArsR family transcriptional regulator
MSPIICRYLLSVAERVEIIPPGDGGPCEAARSCQRSTPGREYPIRVLWERMCMTRDTDVERCADVFKAMGDKTRLSILRSLFSGERCVTDLARLLGMDAPRVSFHLTRLRFAGLVVDERRGQRVAYRLNSAMCSTDADGNTHIRVEDCTVRFACDGGMR